MDAPFWRQGGILYANLMQPHPLMGVAEQDLGDEYAGNIEDSAALVKRIAQKAQATFGDDFRIVIFSDHPLRPEVWCGAAGFYPAGQCKLRPEQVAKQVPLIVATPSQIELAQLDIDSNLDVFDLLFR